MLLNLLTFMVSFIFMVGMMTLFFLLIKDFGNPRKRMINISLLVLATAVFTYFMFISWGTTWVGAPPY